MSNSMSKAAQMLIDSIVDDMLGVVQNEMSMSEFGERLETRISTFETDTYKYTKEALIEAIKHSHVEP